MLKTRSQEFCGKYVFGVPLGEGLGVVCLSCVVSEASFATPSSSFDNWLAGCRSHAPTANDTVAIRTKYFFIKFRNLSTQRAQRKDSPKDPDSYFSSEGFETRPCDGGKRTNPGFLGSQEANPVAYAGALFTPAGNRIN